MRESTLIAHLGIIQQNQSILQSNIQVYMKLMDTIIINQETLLHLLDSKGIINQAEWIEEVKATVKKLSTPKLDPLGQDESTAGSPVGKVEELVEVPVTELEVVKPEVKEEIKDEDK